MQRSVSALGAIKLDPYPMALKMQFAFSACLCQNAPLNMPRFLTILVLAACLFSPALNAFGSGIVLINGASSAPNKGEQAFTDKAVNRIGKWLEELGVGYSVLTEDELASGRARWSKIIVLPYNPNLGEKQLQRLESFLANGGKVLVFRGSNPRLAELFGVQLGKCQATRDPGRWNFFQFNASAPPSMPKQVIQVAGNICPAFPIQGKSRIIACWQDAEGNLLSDAACLQSDKGFWITHFLLGEDSDSKKKMLLAMLACYDPGLWKNAARNELRGIEHFAGYSRLSDFLAALQNHNSAQDPAISRLIGLINCQYGQLQNSLGNKAYRQAVATASNIKPLLINAYAMSQERTPGKEFHGVWNHSGLGLYPGNWDKTCRALSQAGITAVFPNDLWVGMAHYPSKYASQSEESKKLGDQLAQCVCAAHKNGLEVHLWKVCWNLAWADKDFIERMRKQGRLQKNGKNESTNWLCPSDPANVALELNTLREAASRYDIDGIHLDYIRYPDANTCFCAGCRQRYEKFSGQTVKNWPRDALSGRQSAAYKAWRSRQITEFVRTARIEVKKIKSDLKLSAAVYPKYPECNQSIGQDWGLWVKEGLVDFVCPMDYFPTVSAFNEMLAHRAALSNNGRNVYPGIGVTMTNGDLDGGVFLGQLSRLRKYGCGGFMLFDLNQSLAQNFLPLLGR